jgi:hypothetical protein
MRTGRALCIGVDTTERSRSPAEEDACALALIASARGFEITTVLLGAAAVRTAVLANLREAAKTCRAGDMFLLTFSGHGGRGARGSAWTLFDGTLEDGEIRGALTAFRPGVRVLVISDSCHGGIPANEQLPQDANVSASVLVLSACRQDGYADAAGLPGHFTTALLRVWNGGQPIAGYREFHQRIGAAMPDYQQPNYYQLGSRDPQFESQAPFTV